MGKENPTKLTCYHFLEGKGPQPIQPLFFLLLQIEQQAPYLEQAPVSMTSLALVLESLKSEGREAKQHAAPKASRARTNSLGQIRYVNTNNIIYLKALLPMIQNHREFSNTKINASTNICLALNSKTWAEAILAQSSSWWTGAARALQLLHQGFKPAAKRGFF